MEIFKSFLNIFLLIVIVIGLRYAFLRLKYHFSLEKNIKQSAIELFLGAMWLPIPIDNEDDNKTIKKIKSLNIGLKMFYLLALMLFLLMLGYTILVEYS